MLLNCHPPVHLVAAATAAVRGGGRGASAARDVPAAAEQDALGAEAAQAHLLGRQVRKRPQLGKWKCTVFTCG